MDKERIDQLLVEMGLFESMAGARAAIIAGLIFVDDKRIDKAGHQVPKNSRIAVKGEPLKYASRGGLKLEHALGKFSINVSDRIALDVGASTGGFTDCLLKAGAKKTYAIDVGYGQLAWKLRSDPRVVVVERTNVRYLKTEELYGKKLSVVGGQGSEKASLAVIDVSFISLSKVLPAVYDLLNDQGEVVALVKPQFEARREQVEKGGIVRDTGVQSQVLAGVVESAMKIGFKFKDATYSPIKGADGNIEFFVYLSKCGSDIKIDFYEVVEEANQVLGKG